MCPSHDNNFARKIFVLANGSTRDELNQLEDQKRSETLDNPKTINPYPEPSHGRGAADSAKNLLRVAPNTRS